MTSLAFSERPQINSVMSLCESSDDKLFRKVLHNAEHVLRGLLPPTNIASHNYDLREGAHNRQLQKRTERLTGSNLITRMLYSRLL